MAYKAAKLGTLVELSQGLAINKKTKHLIVDEGTPLIRIKDLFNNNYELMVNAEEAPEKSKLDESDIVVTRTGQVGYVYRGRKGILHNNCFKVEPLDKDTLTKDYLYWVLKHPTIHETMQLISGRAAQPDLTHGAFKSIEIPLPEKRMQLSIAIILDNYEKLIENNQKRIDILEEMAQAIYTEWFVNFRFPGHENVNFVDTELGKIPEDWRIESLRNTVEYYIGGGWGNEEPDSEHDTNTHVIRGTDMPYLKNGNISNTVCRYEKQSRFTSRKMQSDDIVFEVSGGSKDQPVGRAIIVSNNLISRLGNVIPASFCKLIRFKHSPYFFYELLNSRYETREIVKFQVQSTGISNFKFEAFLDEPIVLPETTILEKFSSLISLIVNNIHQYGQRNQILENTRDLLIPKLISGEIDVSELDIGIQEEND